MHLRCVFEAVVCLVIANLLNEFRFILRLRYARMLLSGIQLITILDSRHVVPGMLCRRRARRKRAGNDFAPSDLATGISGSLGAMTANAIAAISTAATRTRQRRVNAQPINSPVLTQVV